MIHYHTKWVNFIFRRKNTQRLFKKLCHSFERISKVPDGIIKAKLPWALNVNSLRLISRRIVESKWTFFLIRFSQNKHDLMELSWGYDSYYLILRCGVSILISRECIFEGYCSTVFWTFSSFPFSCFIKVVNSRSVSSHWIFRLG